MEDTLVSLVSKTRRVSEDYKYFRQAFGPLLISLPTEGSFLSDFIGEMMMCDQFINVEPFDRMDTEELRVDLLDVLDMLRDVLDAYYAGDHLKG